MNAHDDERRTADLERTLEEAERSGLRLAIKGRLVALGLLAAWLVISRAGDPTRALAFAAVIGLFAALGVVHYAIIGSRYEQPWVKYLFVALDLALLSALVATQPIYDSADLPQAMTFRNTVFPYYFVVLAVAAFSFSAGLVLWAGIAGVAGWLGAFWWAVRDMPYTLDWSDVPPEPSAEQFLGVFLRPEFIGTGSRVQESVSFLVVAILIAIVTRRARRTVRRQAELDQERATISEVFGRYVPASVADALISDRGTLAPVEREATILFADIAGFTTMTEEAGPQRIVRVLNAYFDAVTRLIGERGGVVTQFQGDAVLATFNVPLADADHARQAVESALAISALGRARDFDGMTVRARVGVATGHVVAGSVGGGGRESYTVHGDTVNLAARLEAMNKALGTSVLIARSTIAQVPGAAFRQVGAVDVRGLREPVAVYTPASAPHPADASHNEREQT